jgi:hypothetical protein
LAKQGKGDDRLKDSKPGPFKLYKKIGALSVSIIPPQFEDGYLIKNGAVLLEAAPGAGPRKWDWKNKITFALSVEDIAHLMDSTKPSKDIYHQHNNNDKKLLIVPGKDNYAGTYMLSLFHTINGQSNKVAVPFSNGEWQVFLRLLVHALPMMLNWTENAVENSIRE